MMTAATMPRIGAEVTVTPQPLAATTLAAAGVPGIMAMVMPVAPRANAATKRCQGMSHSLKIGRASGIRANMTTKSETPP